MAASFFFYDLETSGFNSSSSRIMQFAGQRTDLELNLIGEPVNLMIQMTEDVLPDPDAVLITGITPQMTISEGLYEAEFLRFFVDEIVTADTIFVGFNSIRFDDEFMRCLHYRNFYDPYEWQWQDGRSRWDLLDVTRMTRALRPDGIAWPADTDGRSTNRLELLTKLNKLKHAQAHDALSDVYATIEIARLVRNKQQKLFDYLLKMRDKKQVADLVQSGQPFIYTSGRYPHEFEKTTIVTTVCKQPERNAVYVYDLRYDPQQFADMTAQQLAEAWRYKSAQELSQNETRLPVKLLQFNRCPAVAPLGVLDAVSQERLKVDLGVIEKHVAILKKMPDFPAKLCEAANLLDTTRLPKQINNSEKDVDNCIYDGFFDNQDKQAMRVVRAASPEELSDLGLNFHDQRLNKLLPIYKARNYPRHLNSEERTAWEVFCQKRLLEGGQNSRLSKYMQRLQQLANRTNLSSNQQYLLEELRLYAESIMPASDV